MYVCNNNSRKSKTIHLMKSKEEYMRAFGWRKRIKDMLQLNHNLKVIEMIFK